MFKSVDGEEKLNILYENIRKKEKELNKKNNPSQTENLMIINQVVCSRSNSKNLKYIYNDIHHKKILMNKDYDICRKIDNYDLMFDIEDMVEETREEKYREREREREREKERERNRKEHLEEEGQLEKEGQSEEEGHPEEEEELKEEELKEEGQSEEEQSEEEEELKEEGQLEEKGQSEEEKKNESKFKLKDGTEIKYINRNIRKLLCIDFLNNDLDINSIKESSYSKIPFFAKNELNMLWSSEFELIDADLWNDVGMYYVTENATTIKMFIDHFIYVFEINNNIEDVYGDHWKKIKKDIIKELKDAFKDYDDDENEYPQDSFTYKYYSDKGDKIIDEYKDFHHDDDYFNISDKDRKLKDRIDNIYVHYKLKYIYNYFHNLNDNYDREYFEIKTEQIIKCTHFITYNKLALFNKFISRFINPVIRGSESYCIAGGSLFTLINSGYLAQDQDIDLFLFDDYYEEKPYNYINLINRLVHRLFMDQTVSRTSIKVTDSELSTTISFDMQVLVQFLPLFYPSPTNFKTINIQIIKKIYPNFSLLLHGFDIGASSIGLYNDEFYMTERFYYSLITRQIPIDYELVSLSYAERLNKYSKRNLYVYSKKKVLLNPKITIPELKTDSITYPLSFFKLFNDVEIIKNGTLSFEETKEILNFSKQYTHVCSSKFKLFRLIYFYHLFDNYSYSYNSNGKINSSGVNYSKVVSSTLYNGNYATYNLYVDPETHSLLFFIFKFAKNIDKAITATGDKMPYDEKSLVHSLIKFEELKYIKNSGIERFSLNKIHNDERNTSSFYPVDCTEEEFYLR